MAKPSNDRLRFANAVVGARGSRSIAELEKALVIYVWCAMSGQCQNRNKHRPSIDQLLEQIAEIKKAAAAPADPNLDPKSTPSSSSNEPN